ncbi:MAG TPA: hypothetical protein VHV10_02470 [Ktedonobacteraceae bacterium]|jgi:hypothetical protein|nr:hypothetical protein [Ktedonobacteraceae bacterium]
MTEENPFAKRDREITERDKRYGIDDLQGVDRAKVWYEAHTRIQDNNITDEEEKRKVYTEVKQLYLEYKAQKEEMA